MKLIVISPELDRPDEIELVGELFALGLERFHVRKPRATAAELEAYIRRVPANCRKRIVLHQHHELVVRYGLGGMHSRDNGVSGTWSPGAIRLRDAEPIASRSCHDLTTLRAALGAYGSVLFGPVFESISKPGYGPKSHRAGEAVSAVLTARTEDQRRTAVFAIGGITVETTSRARGLGFDGVAVLGVVWQAADPVQMFRNLLFACAASGGTPPTRESDRLKVEAAEAGASRSN